MAPSPSRSFFSQPSWLIVLISGSILVFFLVAITREIFQGHHVRLQVKRLHEQVAAEDAKQRQLQDVADYLASPTFQEREARLKLGLKKEGERVIVVPLVNSTPAGTSGSQPAGNNGQDGPTAGSSVPRRWWSYFFSPTKHS